MAITINGTTGIQSSNIQGIIDLINTGNTTLGDASSDSVTINGGIINLAAAGATIKGDFSNATFTSRTRFSSSVTNGNTFLSLVPNGSGTLTGVESGAFPIAFNTNGSERLRIGTSGEIGISGANYGTSGQVLTSGGSGASPTWSTVDALPSQTGNSGKYLTTNGTVSSWTTLSIPGTGGSTSTGSTTLTSSSASAMTVTPSTPGLYATLPDATTCSTGSILFSIYNAGDYDYGVKDSTGTKIGWIPPKTGAVLGLTDKSTAAGIWSASGLSKLGVTAEFVNSTLNNMNQFVQKVTLDSTRTCLLFGGTDCYAVIYDSSTNTWGSATLVRATVQNVAWVCTLSATNQVLVVSCSSTTALEAVTLTISGTTITVNTGTKGTATLAGNYSEIGQLIAVGSSWVVGYGRSTTSSCIRAITISGTTPTIGAETVLSGATTTAPILFTTGSIVRGLTITAQLLTCTPVTVSGTTLTSGTAATATTASASLRAFQNGNGNIVAEYINATHYASIFKLTGTTEAVSSVSLGTSPTAIVNYADYAIISSSKTLFTSTPASSTNWWVSILTDTNGTASVGTVFNSTIPTSTSALVPVNVSGNSVRCVVSTLTYAMQITFDCSGTSPVVSSIRKMNSSSGLSITSPQASDLYGNKRANMLYAGTMSYFMTAGYFPLVSGTNQLRFGNTYFNTPGTLHPSYGCNGATSSESFMSDTLSSNNPMGIVLYKIEAAA